MMVVCDVVHARDLFKLICRIFHYFYMDFVSPLSLKVESLRCILNS